MRKLKKAFSLALALAMCLGLMAVPSSAAGATLTEIISPEVWDSFDWHQGSGMEAFHDGVAWRGSNDGYGAFDTDGNVIVQPYTYKDVKDFSEGVAWGERGGLWCAIDKTGKELFTLSSGYRIMDDKGNFSDGLAKVYSDETKAYGFVDKSGSLVIPCEYESVGEFHDGLAWVYDKANAYYGFIDKTGKLALPFRYSNVWVNFDNGMAVVEIGKSKLVIDKTGKEVIPQGYAFVKKISSETLVVVSLDENGNANGYYFMNKAGRVVGTAVYDNYYGTSFNFVDGLAQNGKGYINESGELVIPRQYTSAGDFADGYAVVRTGDRDDYSRTIIDKTGRVTATLPEYFESNFLAEGNAGNGCFMISSRESGRQRFGFVNYTGKEIVPCKYKKVGNFSGGVAAVQDFSNKWGFVDTTGAEIVPCTLGWVQYTEEPGIFVVNNFNGDNKTSVIKSSGWTEPTVPTTPTQPQQPAGETASPTNDKLEVNGNAADPTVYKINGSNYFKIRDVAALLNGTEKQFAVGYDGAKNAVTATTGQGYDKQSGDLAGAAKGGDQSAAASNDAVYVNGEKITAEVYKINGSNYFKLRDLGKALDFYVGWSAQRGMYIETGKPYSE